MIFYLLRKKIKLLVFKKKWRTINKHNQTYVTDVFPIDKVSVGEYTYGSLNIKSFLNPSERLTIGDYVSIADNVLFILGGNHQTKNITLYPLYSKLISNSPEKDALTKGEVVIEDGVWIGSNSIILSGTRIGQGAVIAAGSVVVKDVLPFSIIGGNPAKFIKYRITEKNIKILMKFKLSNLLSKVDISNINDFYEDVDKFDLNSIK